MQKIKVGIVSKNSQRCTEIKDKLCKYLLNTNEFEIYEEGIEEDLSKVDLDRILVFGGDGTMLRAAKIGSKTHAPVLGVNFGNLGFLAQIENTITGEELVALLKSDKSEKLNFLEAKTGKRNYLALNDIVIKSNTARPIVLDVFVNGVFADEYHSDGVILSTPTGSTAYSLSAGGPIVAPEVHALIINPVCPHSLHSRPLIISDKCTVDFVVRGEECANLIVDGDLAMVLENNQDLRIKQSEKYCEFAFVEEENGFYTKLLEKLNRWGTTSI